MPFVRALSDFQGNKPYWKITALTLQFMRRLCCLYIDYKISSQTGRRVWKYYFINELGMDLIIMFVARLLTIMSVNEISNTQRSYYFFIWKGGKRKREKALLNPKMNKYSNPTWFALFALILLILDWHRFGRTFTLFTKKIRDNSLIKTPR